MCVRVCRDVLENVGPGHDMNGICQLGLSHDT